MTRLCEPVVLLRRATCATALLALVLALALALAMAMAPAWASAAKRATADSPARMTVELPPETQNLVRILLELSIRGFQHPPGAKVGGVVRLRTAGGDSIEVGRFSLFPSEPFRAARVEEERRFRFDATNAIRQFGVLGRAEVEVALVDRAGNRPPAGSKLSIGGVRIVRP